MPCICAAQKLCFQQSRQQVFGFVQTTNTENFVVSPPFGVVEPGTTKLVKVYFKAHSAYTDDLRFCKDCFLVQSIVVDDEMAEREITSDLFKSRQRQEAKLKVLVVQLACPSMCQMQKAKPGITYCSGDPVHHP